MPSSLIHVAAGKVDSGPAPEVANAVITRGSAMHFKTGAIDARPRGGPACPRASRVKHVSLPVPAAAGATLSSPNSIIATNVNGPAADISEIISVSGPAFDSKPKAINGSSCCWLALPRAVRGNHIFLPVSAMASATPSFPNSNFSTTTTTTQPAPNAHDVVVADSDGSAMDVNCVAFKRGFSCRAARPGAFIVKTGSLPVSVAAAGTPFPFNHVAAATVSRQVPCAHDVVVAGG
jgi:hypothetical protein